MDKSEDRFLRSLMENGYKPKRPFSSHMIDLSEITGDNEYYIPLSEGKTAQMFRQINEHLIAKYQCIVEIEENYDFHAQSLEQKTDGRALLHEPRFEMVDVTIKGIVDNNPTFEFKTNNQRTVRVADRIVSGVQEFFLTYLLNMEDWERKLITKIPKAE
ncbi:hypothetical protein [Apilactobacillus nanyangensis]|uniref:hypothetical protein n=1 Tax=Apilactobacillus nanyangensis TaxID=2799579 RepID=UPI00194505B9|nr:hypothetical protein [Apilactobacillus nanyangensis]